MTLRVTLRDLEILNALYAARYMTTPQIQSLYWGADPDGQFGNLKACQRRLRQLTKHGLIRRIEQLVGRGEGRLPYIYTLDKEGAEALIQELGLDASHVDWRKKDSERTYPFLQHLLATNDFRISLMLACQRLPEVQLESWVDEKELKTEAKDTVVLSGSEGQEKEVAVVPDGYFVLGMGKQQAHHFVEIDRATVTVRPTKWARRGWVRKIEAYLAYYRSGKFNQRYGTRSLRILTVTTGPERLYHLLKTTEQAGGKARFWFTTFELANQPGKVLSEPIWQVAGREGVHRLLP